LDFAADRDEHDGRRRVVSARGCRAGARGDGELMRITVEVTTPRGVSREEVERAIAEGEPACLEMPGWGSAPEVRIVAVEDD
jgi:hypothetical protein